jgi:hypothetical protein
VQKYELLADAIVTVHFAWIAYVVIGQILILLGIAGAWRWIRNFWFRFTHLTMMLLVAVETLFGIDCPLTIWEKRCRGLGVYQGLTYTENDSFIARVLGNIIFFELDGGSWPFVVGYLGFTALVVWSFWMAPPRLPMATASFVALVHLCIGVILTATVPDRRGVGVCFLVQAALWYCLQEKATPDVAESNR